MTAKVTFETMMIRKIALSFLMAAGAALLAASPALAHGSERGFVLLDSQINSPHMRRLGVDLIFRNGEEALNLILRLLDHGIVMAGGL